MVLLKKWSVLLFAFAIAMLLALPDAAAQSHKKKKKKKKKPVKKEQVTKKKEEKKKAEDEYDPNDDQYFKEAPPKFTDKLWYGGGFNLGFNQYNGASVFSLGLSPMVGYKIWGPFSLGPRLGTTFTSYKVAGYKAAGLFDWETGLFARAKLGPIFLHGEISNQWIQQPLDYDGTKWKKAYDERVNQYLGLGYNAADGGVGYEILLLYNFRVAKDVNSINNPLGFRVGFTWKF